MDNPGEAVISTQPRPGAGTPTLPTLRAYCPVCRQTREGRLEEVHDLASWLTVLRWNCPSCNHALIHGQLRS